VYLHKFSIRLQGTEVLYENKINTINHVKVIIEQKLVN
jgi:hypothetical protein